MYWITFSIHKISWLYLDGRPGFGRSISFAEDLQVPPGHVLPFKDALHIVSEYMIYTAVIPRQVLFFNEKVRKIRDAFYELHVCDPFRELSRANTDLILTSK